MMHEITEREKYSDLFIQQGYLVNSYDLVTREDIEPYISGARFLEISDESTFRQACTRIMKKNRKCNVVLFSKKQFTLAVSKTGKKLYPLLDDVAQLCGTAIRCISSIQSIPYGLLSKSALLVRDKGCLCMAGNLYEAHALAMVVEKACGAQIAASILGGGKPIKTHEAMLMRLIYLLKYSKKLN